MAHDIESMFSVRETPWHGLGTVLSDAPTTADAIRLAGLDWTVQTRNLATIDGGIRVPARACVRSTDSRVLGVVGEDYTPLQNADAFGWFDPFIDAKLATLETAGSLRDGQRVWILAQLAGGPVPIVGDDLVRRYLLLSNSHDGTMAVRVGFTPIRVVCANTLAAAHSASESTLIRVRHTKSVSESVDSLREIINAKTGHFEATLGQYRRLANTDISAQDLGLYVKRVFKVGGVESDPDSEQPGARQDEPQPSGARILPRIQELAEVGKGADLPGSRGTLWGAYNAVSEYLGYERGSSQDVRLDSLWFGASAQLNRRALDVAIRMAS